MPTDPDMSYRRRREFGGFLGILMIILKWVFNVVKYIVKQIGLEVNNYRGNITFTINV
jgi:hypothetical protein